MQLGSFVSIHFSATASNEQWDEFNERFIEFLSNGGDIFEDENATESSQTDEIASSTLTISDGLKALNGMKMMCIEQGHTNLFRLVASAISETERVLSSGANKTQSNILDYFAKK